MPTRHHWADVFIVRRQGPDGRKGSTNSTATCSTWRGMGSARLYFAQDSPCDDNTQPYHTGSVAARVNKDRAFRRTPGRRCQMCYWCIIEDSRKRQHHHRHLEHKDTKSRKETSGTNTDHVTNEEVRANFYQAIGPHEDLLTIVKRRKLQWYGQVSRSSGVAKNILQGTVKERKRKGREEDKADRERQHQEMYRPGVRQVPEGNGEQGRMEETGCEITCGAPTTLAFKG